MKHEGFDKLAERMMEAIQELRKVVKLKIPQAQYALVSQLMEEGRVISSEYVENDILLEVEIPTSLEKKFKSFLIG